MRVYAKATFALGKTEDISRPLTIVRNGQIQDIPEWCAKDLTFKMAVKSGEIELIGSKEQERNAEMDASQSKRGNRKKEGVQDETDASKKTDKTEE